MYTATIHASETDRTMVTKSETGYYIFFLSEHSVCFTCLLGKRNLRKAYYSLLLISVIASLCDPLLADPALAPSIFSHPTKLNPVHCLPLYVISEMNMRPKWHGEIKCNAD